MAEREPERRPVLLLATSCVGVSWAGGPQNASKYYRARYYDPKRGRFISEDPIRLQGGVNFYGYVGANPTGRIDPSGLDWITVAVITRIRPPDAQAGVKSLQSVVIDTTTGRRVKPDFDLTGRTIVFDHAFDARSTTFTSSSALRGQVCRIGVKGETGSKWYPFGNINYDLQISYDPSTRQGRVVGSHDGYPSYEVYVDGNKVYDYQQWNLLPVVGGLPALIGEADVSVNKSFP